MCPWLVNLSDDQFAHRDVYKYIYKEFIYILLQLAHYMFWVDVYNDTTMNNEQWTMNFISNLYKLHYITQFTSIYIINIGNTVIQIGGKSIAIYSCLPTFPLEKKNKINKIKHSVMKNIDYSAKWQLRGSMANGVPETRRWSWITLQIYNIAFEEQDKLCITK